jgi:hypothetical protein
MAKIGPQRRAEFQRQVEAQARRMPPGRIDSNRVHQKIADVHIGSSPRAMLTGCSWALLHRYPEERPGILDTPVVGI